MAAHQPAAAAPLCEAVGLDSHRAGVRFSARGREIAGGSQASRKLQMRHLNLFDMLCRDMVSADTDVAAASAAEFVASTAVVPDV